MHCFHIKAQSFELTYGGCWHFNSFKLVRGSMLSRSQNQNSVLVRDIISVVCQAGFYKDGEMKTCQTCTAGKEPNSAKTACGKTAS